MKKMEERMLAAIKEEKRFTIANTEVVPYVATVNGEEKVANVKVFLYGNLIAIICRHNRVINLYTCGWDTVTTTSRMNAILYEFTDGAYYVTCRTYNKMYGKECRLNKRNDSDWKVTLSY